MVLQCPVLFTRFSLLLLPVFPLFVQRKPEGPRHTPSTMTLEIPQEQLLQTSNSWERNTQGLDTAVLSCRGESSSSQTGAAPSLPSDIFSNQGDRLFLTKKNLKKINELAKAALCQVLS